MGRDTLIKTMPLVLVQWNDANVNLGWDTEITQVEAIHSVGWKIHEDKKSIVLAADVGDKPRPLHPETTETNRRIAIPKDWVTSIKELK